MDTTDPRVIFGTGSNSRVSIAGAPLPSWPRLMGIVGGVGPFAHIELEQRLLDAAKERLIANKKSTPMDQEFPPWIVVSLPQIPDRSEALQMKGPCPVPMLMEGLTLLKRCQCDFAIIPCNTAHAWISELEQASPIPILDMVQATIWEAIKSFGPEARLGLLATDGTIDHDVYPSRAASISKKIRFVSPLNLAGGRSAQERVMSCIYGPKQKDGTRSGGIKSGSHITDTDFCMSIQRDLCEIIDQMDSQGTQAIILGCTELPLVIDPAVIDRQLKRKIHLMDPMHIVAKAAIQIAAGEDQINVRPQ